MRVVMQVSGVGAGVLVAGAGRSWQKAKVA